MLERFQQVDKAKKKEGNGTQRRDNNFLTSVEYQLLIKFFQNYGYERLNGVFVSIK